MNDLIITGGNVDHFTYLQLFVSSLRANGRFSGTIALCDNLIEGTWDKPGRFLEGGSFTAEQLRFFKDHEVAVFEYSELLASNDIPRESIDCIRRKHSVFPISLFIRPSFPKNTLKRHGTSVFSMRMSISKNPFNPYSINSGKMAFLSWESV